jgi:very-short-patch-repair endonuclease
MSRLCHFAAMPTRQMISGPTSTIQRARKLRQEMTLPEVKLWGVLRTRTGGFKFRRQHPAGVYILDFYCAAVRLAIEVDGWAHDTGGVAKADAVRGAALREQHIATLRVPATAVLEDLEPVLTRIVQVCTERAARLPPLQGRGTSAAGGGAPAGTPKSEC